jgi:hypothetical protein
MEGTVGYGMWHQHRDGIVIVHDELRPSKQASGEWSLSDKYVVTMGIQNGISGATENLRPFNPDKMHASPGIATHPIPRPEYLLPFACRQAAAVELLPYEIAKIAGLEMAQGYST